MAAAAEAGGATWCLIAVVMTPVPNAAIAAHPVGVDRAGHREPVLGLAVVDAVAAQDVDARLADFVQATPQDVSQ